MLFYMIIIISYTIGLNFKIRLKIRSLKTIRSILNLKVIGKFNKEIVQTLISC